MSDDALRIARLLVSYHGAQLLTADARPRHEAQLARAAAARQAAARKREGVANEALLARSVDRDVATAALARADNLHMEAGARAFRCREAVTELTERRDGRARLAGLRQKGKALSAAQEAAAEAKQRALAQLQETDMASALECAAEAEASEALAAVRACRGAMEGGLVKTLCRPSRAARKLGGSKARKVTSKTRHIPWKHTIRG